MTRPPRRRIKITHVEFPSGARLTRTEGEGFKMVHFEGPYRQQEIYEILADKIIDQPKEPKP